MQFSYDVYQDDLHFFDLAIKEPIIYRIIHVGETGLLLAAFNQLVYFDTRTKQYSDIKFHQHIKPDYIWDLYQRNE